MVTAQKRSGAEMKMEMVDVRSIKNRRIGSPVVGTHGRWQSVTWDEREYAWMREDETEAAQQ